MVGNDMPQRTGNPSAEDRICTCALPWIAICRELTTLSAFEYDDSEVEFYLFQLVGISRLSMKGEKIVMFNEHSQVEPGAKQVGPPPESDSPNGEETQGALFPCPHCRKVCKSPGGLKKHHDTCHPIPPHATPAGAAPAHHHGDDGGDDGLGPDNGSPPRFAGPDNDESPPPSPAPEPPASCRKIPIRLIRPDTCIRPYQASAYQYQAVSDGFR
ncbi:hypothetical protein C8R47DRAFT_1190532 [Mycena vitilis]|nr:hypothetical protein C8R47DRAFT_1190532 [Mycena vitilis]